MSISEESNTVCDGLDNFCVPAALVHIGRDRFIAWNSNFLRVVECSSDELRLLPVRELVGFGSEKKDTECSEAPGPVYFESCIVKSTNSQVNYTGRAFRRGDDYVFIVLEAAEGSDDATARGKLAGATEERERVLRILHDSVSQELLVAVFAVETMKNAFHQNRTDLAMDELSRLAEALSRARTALEQIGTPS